jgi:hypothetical protein
MGMGTTDGENEVGYGMDDKRQRLATFVDGVIFSVGNGQLNVDLLNEIEAGSGLTKRILVARAAGDLDDPAGKFVIEFIGGKGERFVSADSFSFSRGDGSPESEKYIAGLLVDMNSPEFEDSPKDPSVTQNGMEQLLNGIAETQGRIEKEPDKFMTRTEYLELRGE